MNYSFNVLRLFDGLIKIYITKIKNKIKRNDVLRNIK
jgi:hypothetical protein